MADQLRIHRDTGRVHGRPIAIKAGAAAQDVAGPPIAAIRVWPRDRRCRVAVRPPFQLVAPTDGVPCCGSPVGSRITKGMPRVRSWLRIVSLRSEKTAMTPVGRRASTLSIHPRPGMRRPWISESTTDR